MANAYHIGQKIRLRGMFYDEDNVLADPTTVTMRVRDAADFETAYIVTGGQIVKDAVGDYHLDIIPAGLVAEGRWDYRVIGVGVIDSAKEDHFLVRATAFDTP